MNHRAPRRPDSYFNPSTTSLERSDGKTRPFPRRTAARSCKPSPRRRSPGYSASGAKRSTRPPRGLPPRSAARPRRSAATIPVLAAPARSTRSATARSSRRHPDGCAPRDIQSLLFQTVRIPLRAVGARKRSPDKPRPGSRRYTVRPAPKSTAIIRRSVEARSSPGSAGHRSGSGLLLARAVGLPDQR
jgi:hypothetical protein